MIGHRLPVLAPLLAAGDGGGQVVADEAEQPGVGVHVVDHGGGGLVGGAQEDDADGARGGRDLPELGDHVLGGGRHLVGRGGVRVVELGLRRGDPLVGVAEDGHSAILEDVVADEVGHDEGEQDDENDADAQGQRDHAQAKTAPERSERVPQVKAPGARGHLASPAR